VTAEVTKDVCLLARMMAANLYFSDMEDLMFEVHIRLLALWMFNLHFLSTQIQLMLFSFLTAVNVEMQ